VDVELKVGDPVYYKNNQRQSKLQSKWKPFYRIVEQISPQTFKIKTQLDGKVTKAHKELLRLAKIDERDIPKNELCRPLRKSAYVVPPESETNSDESDNETPENNKMLHDTNHERDTENEFSDSLANSDNG
jgi:hypothetical protein